MSTPSHFLSFHCIAECCPEAPSILEMVLSACGGGVGGSDRTGRTLFDIEEKVPSSCLAAGMSFIVRATKSRSQSVLCVPHTPSSVLSNASEECSLAGLNERVSHFKFEDISRGHGYDGAADECALIQHR